MPRACQDRLHRQSVSTGTSTRSPVTVSRNGSGICRGPVRGTVDPAGNYTLDFHGTKEALGTYSFEVG